MLVSVVIPCYKSEPFIRECLDSILNQSYATIEVVCVNDNSPDGTLRILHDYAEIDARVRVYTLNRNSGSANYPLDYGVSLSHGDWVCLVGHDDVLSPDYLLELTKKQRATGADIVMSRMCSFVDKFGDSLKIPADGFDFNQLLSGRSAVMKTIGVWEIGANGALIKAEIWKNRSKYLDKTFNHMNADEFATREILVMSRKVAFADVAYHYRKHESSITQDSSRGAESLITDAEIVSLFSRTYGKNSAEYRKALSVYIAAFMEWCRKKSVDTDYLYKHYIKIKSESVFSSSFTLLRKCTFRLPFRLFRMCLR